MQSPHCEQGDIAAFLESAQGVPHGVTFAVKLVFLPQTLSCFPQLLWNVRVKESTMVLSAIPMPSSMLSKEVPSEHFQENQAMEKLLPEAMPKLANHFHTCAERIIAELGCSTCLCELEFVNVEDIVTAKIVDELEQTLQLNNSLQFLFFVHIQLSSKTSLQKLT